MRDEDSPPAIRYPEWQAEYQAAVMELDRRQLAKRVAEAEAAIAKRLQAISQSADHTLNVRPSKMPFAHCACSSRNF